jgi:dephospho-CoA kinase
MKWLICLAGGIASGKTTLAGALHAALPDSALLAFGDVVRRRARAAHSEPTRQDLQDTGLRLIGEGWPAFVNELLLEFEGDSSVLIVEGVRHREAVDALRERLHKRRLLLIYIEVSYDQRRERLTRRAESEQALIHDVERDVESLHAIADLVVGTHQPLEDLVAHVCAYVEAYRESSQSL